MHQLVADILQAELRIRQHTLTTPLLPSLPLSKNGAQAFLKLENEQYTGSFKARGSLNKVLWLSDKARKGGVGTASTGNHGLGVARAASIAKVKATIFVPESADASKVAAIKQYGAEVRRYKNSLSETEAHAQVKRYIAEHGMTWVAPYNDPQVIAGQGTIAIELSKQLESIDAVFVTVGGGGLVAGIAAYLKAVSPQTSIIGCVAENSAEMFQSVKAGKFVKMPSRPSIADGSAGGFEEGSITFELCRQLVDEWELVSEAEIKAAIKLIAKEHHKIIEGAAGVAVASFLKRQPTLKGKRVVILICGGNISTDLLKTIL